MRAEGETQAAIALEAKEKERAKAQHAKDQAFHEKMVKQVGDRERERARERERGAEGGRPSFACKAGSL